jgi:ribonuclease HI
LGNQPLLFLWRITLTNNKIYDIMVDIMKNAQVWTDGGSRGNPGESAIGVVMMMDDKKTEHSTCIGIATNNVAEYTALLLAVKLCAAAEAETLFVRSDSELMVNQIKGLFIVRDEKLKVIYDKIIKLLPKFRAFHIEHVRREENKEADALVNLALDKKLKKNG